jgi:hypothetical protein
MPRITMTGQDEVASLLQRLADGVAAGEIRLPDRSVPCPPGIAAVVDGPDVQGSSFALSVMLHSGEEALRRPSHSLEVEQELTHPGG